MIKSLHAFNYIISAIVLISSLFLQAEQQIVVSVIPLSAEYYKDKPKEISTAVAYSGNILAYGGAYGFTDPSTGQLIFTKQHLGNQVKVLVTTTNIEAVLVQDSVKHFKIVDKDQKPEASSTNQASSTNSEAAKKEGGEKPVASVSKDLSTNKGLSVSEMKKLGKLFILSKEANSWDIREESLRPDQVIEKSTIILFDDPSRVFFEVKQPFVRDEDLVLPSIMIDTTIPKPANLEFLPLLKYLERLNEVTKISGNVVVSKAVPAGVVVNDLPANNSTPPAKKKPNE